MNNFLTITLAKLYGSKGRDSNFEENIFQILKVATNETFTWH